jgi:hypothetical protein
MVARAAEEYGVDAANVLILTPLPGTELYARMKREGRIQSDDYTRDWQYYTLTYPVAEYKNLTWAQLGEEVTRFNDRFYSYPRILRRLLQLARNTHNPRTLLVVLVANLSCRYNYLSERRICTSRVHSLKPGRAAASAASIQGSVLMKVQTAATTATRTPVVDQETGARFCSLQLSAQGRTEKYPQPESVHRKQ